MTPNIALVTTTINDMPALDSYVKAAQQYAGDVRIIVIPDRKTDPTLFGRVERLQNNVVGFRVRLECPAIEEQEAFLARIGAPEDFIPYDSDNRRNVGFLMALTEGPDVLVSVDDDNFVLSTEDFFTQHAVVYAGKQPVEVAHAPRGYVNICDMMDYQDGQILFPRGFPYRYRKTSVSLEFYQSCAEVHMNTGLWLHDPDVDAISRLAGVVYTTGLKQGPIVLSPSTWTPINTQNTAINGSAIPAYYYIRMGHQLHGLPIDRFGDILSGYFCQACVRSLGRVVRVGTPLVEHRRNWHNLLKDLANELGGVLMIEDLADWFCEQQMAGSNYTECYIELADALECQATRFRGLIWESGGRAFLKLTAKRMRQWTVLCKEIVKGVGS
jgi:hypothetical protein